MYNQFKFRSMRTKNRFELRGFVGAAPEVKTLDNGKKVATLRVATNEAYTSKKSGEKTKETDWHHVTLWNGLAGIAEKYVNKGALVSVEGRIKPRSFQNKEGETAYTIDFVVDYLDIILNKEAE
jgi:single-strand DNA-binding protein